MPIGNSVYKLQLGKDNRICVNMHLYVSAGNETFQQQPLCRPVQTKYGHDSTPHRDT